MKSDRREVIPTNDDRRVQSNGSETVFSTGGATIMAPTVLTSITLAGALLLQAPLASAWDYAAEICVDRSTQYQVVDGWGCAEAFQRAEDVLGEYGLSSQNQSYVLDLLFDVERGAGFTILRNGIGSSNSSMSNFMNTIEPMEPSSPSAQPNYTWDHYSSGQLPVSQAAKDRGVPYIYADAWSAPGFMKTNHDDANGGYICGVPNTTCSSGDWRQAYANYLIQFWKYWNDAGVPITQLGFYNEPSFETNYASMLTNGTQAADFIRILGATIEREGIDVELTCCDDYGWNQQEALMAGLQTVDEESGRSGESYLSVITGHGYASAPTFPLSTSLRVWETEWADLAGGYTPYTFWNNSGPGEGLTWASHIQTAFTSANVSAFLYWIGAENSTSNSGLINLINDEVIPSKRFWSFAQFSRFVRPGARRIDVTGGTNGTLTITGFENVDGTVAIQVLNNATDDTTVRIQMGQGKIGNVQSYITDNYHDLDEQDSFTLGNDGFFDTVVKSRSLTSFVQACQS